MYKMKKRVISIALTLILCVGLFAGCGNSSSDNNTPAQSNNTSAPAQDDNTPAADTADDSQPVSLLWAHGMNSTTTKPIMWGELCDKVNELSNGTITIDIEGDGTIVADDATLDAVLTDVTQFGALTYTYLAGIMPELNVMCLPGWFTGDKEDFEAFDKESYDVIDRIFAAHGLKYLGNDFTGQSSIFGNGEPATTPDALKGKIVRTSGNVQTAAIEAWGGAGTVIALGDLTTALERKTVDAAFSGYALIHAFSFDEVCDYAVMLPALEPGHCFFMTLDKWNTLSASQQEVMMEVFSNCSGDVWERSYEEEYEPYLEEYREAGCEVYELTSEEFAPFTELLQPIFDSYKEDNTEDGLELMKIVYKYNGWDWVD
jgi:TRAP-type C4-dicarboxylate transport system substrate-binding protein